MPQTHRRRRDGGFTLIEVVIALCVIVLTLIGLIAGISYASRTNATIHEDELAMRGAQKMVETIRSYPVGMVWACFNNSPNDASGLPSAFAWNPTAYPEMASNLFEVEGLQPVKDSVNGVVWDKCGMVSFPGDQTTNIVEITDTTDPMYDENGTDLNANAATGETLSITDPYNLLPVTITIRWRGINGVRTMTFRCLLINTPTGSASDFKYPGQS
jgi:type II secretory pathway pseudopilin PulG